MTVPQADERMSISQTIVEHVLEQGQGVITSDAPTDKRFSPAQSVVDLQIREAICVPIRGRHTTLGVIYADIQAGGAPGSRAPAASGRFSQEQLTLMVAIGHQAGLAIENTIFYNEKIQAERLAAVGQTIATLSHHIKNILQGIHGGSSLIDLGLKEKDDSIVRRGWTIVEKNQNKIYNMVMDMLSFSKDREPALEPTDLNETIGDVVELMQSRATELGVKLSWHPGADLPEVTIDPDGIHRAVLNIVTNAIDACEGAENAQVIVKTSGSRTVRPRDRHQRQWGRHRGRRYPLDFSNLRLDQGLSRDGPGLARLAEDRSRAWRENHRHLTPRPRSHLPDRAPHVKTRRPRRHGRGGDDV